MPKTCLNAIKPSYVLEDGVKGLLAPALQVLRAQPRRFFSTLWLALRMGRRADRSWPYHLVYLLEACRVLSLVAGVWRQACARAFRHQLHRGGDAGQRAWRAGVQFYRARPGRVRQAAVHSSGRESPARGVCRGHQRLWAQPAVSLGRSCALGSKVKVVHCGLERAFHDVPAVAVPSAPRLVCVGRLCEQKGQLLLLEAARRLAEQGRGVRDGAGRRWRNARADRSADRTAWLAGAGANHRLDQQRTGARGNSRGAGPGACRASPRACRWSSWKPWPCAGRC